MRLLSLIPVVAGVGRETRASSARDLRLFGIRCWVLMCSVGSGLERVSPRAFPRPWGQKEAFRLMPHSPFTKALVPFMFSLV